MSGGTAATRFRLKAMHSASHVTRTRRSGRSRARKTMAGYA
jgi:hypothetical protein